MKYVKDKELLIIITIYIFITINLITKDMALYMNVINPMFWGTILIYLIWNIKKYYIRFNINKRYFIAIFIISCVYVVSYFYIGFILGFSKSPYNHDILSILKNIITRLLPIISIEITRAVIVTRNKNNKLVLVITTILLILAEINYSALIMNRQEVFQYIFSDVAGIVSVGILSTYLTLKGSYLLPVIYRLFNKVVILILPILPNINWFISGAINVISPIVVYILFKYELIKENKDMRKQKENLKSKISYTLAISFSITLICFMLGIFKHEPIAILSNSMAPTFNRGDIVIFKKLEEEQLKEISIGTIIVYTIGDQNIAHRIVDVKKENGTVLYKTKGDSNNIADMEQVQINQIKGVYAFHIKYIGFPSVFLYDFFNHKEAEVEIK